MITVDIALKPEAKTALLTVIRAQFTYELSPQANEHDTLAKGLALLLRPHLVAQAVRDMDQTPIEGAHAAALKREAAYRAVTATRKQAEAAARASAEALLE